MSALPAEDYLGAPAYRTSLPRDGSLVRAVEGVAAKLGRSLDPTQRDAVDVLTSAWKDGRPASLEAAVICPRQNLKTYILELITLTRLLRPGGDRLAVWSAHEVSTAQETFKTILDLTDTVPWLAEQIEHVSRATGREAITFRGGKRLKFKARVKTGGRGLAGDLIVLDEAFALQPEHMGSLLPILSTKTRGQVLYGSSAPHASSAILHRIVKRGRAGGITYLEWSAPGSLREPGCKDPSCDHEPGQVDGDRYVPLRSGCVMDEESIWLRANPAAVHGRISMHYLRSERGALTPLEFARERLGWPEELAVVNAPISVQDWLRRADPESEFVGRPVFSVVVARDLRSAGIFAAGYREDGTAHVEIVDLRSGTDWLVGRAAELKKHRPVAWVLDKKTPAAALLPDLKAAGIKPHEMNTTEYAQACSLLQAAVRDGSVVHMGDEPLLHAVAGADRRDIGEGWAWNPKTSEVDIVPLVGVTLAHWLLSVTPKPRPLVAFK